MVLSTQHWPKRKPLSFPRGQVDGLPSRASIERRGVPGNMSAKRWNFVSAPSPSSSSTPVLMGELERLGNIIDRLFALKRAGRQLGRRLVFIVGNGIDPVDNILNDRDLRRKAGSHYRTPRAFEAYKWRHFEYARYYTATSLPSFAHCCIFKFVEEGLCRDVITTNYDMFFDTIWEHLSKVRVCRNPIARRGEYLWEGYYSPRKRLAAGARYWKIHGSLSHVCFKNRRRAGTHHIHRLPRFAISANDSLLARRYRIPTQAPFLGFERANFTRTAFANYADLSGTFSPHIDWTWDNEREKFRGEIEGARAVLSDSAKIAAVVLLGFSGYYNDHDPTDPWNEELVPDIRNLHARGFRNVFMAVHEAQAGRIRFPAYGLMRELAARRRCWPYQIAGDFMADLVRDYSRRFPCDYTETEYARWRGWYLPAGEASHV